MRDPEGTRAAILGAATHVFASRGYAGASMRDISDASGVRKPLIYHHFGSKAGLYAAVKQDLAAACDPQIVGNDRADERPADPSAELRRLFETFRDHEGLLRVCAWSRLEMQFSHERFLTFSKLKHHGTTHEIIQIDDSASRAVFDRRVRFVDRERFRPDVALLLDGASAGGGRDPQAGAHQPGRIAPAFG